MEIWKKIPGWETSYEVSSIGRVKSISRNRKNKSGGFSIIKERILKPSPRRMYLGVVLQYENIKVNAYIHRLVAISFLNNEFNDICVLHKDDNTFNNNLSNLKWGSHTDNMNDKLNKNRQPRGEKLSNRLTNTDVIYIRDEYNKGLYSQLELGNMFNVSRSCIQQIVTKKNWAHI